MKVGDLVKTKESFSDILFRNLPRSPGLIVKEAGQEIVYVAWSEGSGKPRPISVRLLEVISEGGRSSQAPKKELDRNSRRLHEEKPRRHGRPFGRDWCAMQVDSQEKFGGDQ